MLIYIHARILNLLNFRWDKYHRYHNTWQYRYLKTTISNIKADNLRGHNESK